MNEEQIAALRGLIDDFERHKVHALIKGQAFREVEQRLDVQAQNDRELQHRLMVLEHRMENVLARLDGHDLGFATMALDDEGKAALARMQRLGRTMDPDEEGTSRS